MNDSFCRPMAVGICVAGMLFAAALPSSGIVITATSGSLSAQATFTDLGGGKLTVLLDNISKADVLAPNAILTGIFFDYTGGALTPLSALLNGSTVLYGANGGGNVGGEWAYGSGLAGAPLGASSGISSSGLGLFGNGNFLGPNLDSPASVGGLSYGITSAGDNPATGNTPVTGANALIKNSVLFTLGYSGAFGVFDNVSFQYGTALTEPNVNVPDSGSSLVLLGVAISGVCLLRRKLS
jgi:hypothetical protein